MVPEDVSLTTAELVEKLEYFKVGEEKTSPLKTLAIKLEVYKSTDPSRLNISFVTIPNLICLQYIKMLIDMGNYNCGDTILNH